MTEDTLKELAVSEDQVKTLLELETYRQRIYDPIRNEAEVNITDEEAQQSSFNYVSISTTDLSDDEIKQKKEDAQKILDDLKAAGSDGDLNEIAKSVDDSYSSVSGTFDVNEDAAKEDSDEEDETAVLPVHYPDEVMKVLSTLKDGEVSPDVIETDTSYYVVKLDKVNEEEARQTIRNSQLSLQEKMSCIQTQQKNGWMKLTSMLRKRF